MNERYVVEAARTFTGCMVGHDCDDEPVRFAPVRFYENYRDGQCQTVRQCLAYIGDDRVWFDSYEQAMEIVYRHADPTDVRADADENERWYWDYEATKWQIEAR